MDAPRRQQRGLARIESILDAATRVIGEHGYERATTNAIAAEAGISPGSLYQYFSDKQAIATALWQRYAADLRAIQDATLTDVTDAPLEDVVARLVGPVHRFKHRNRAFAALLTQGGLPGGFSAVEEANAAYERRIVDLIAARHPGRDRGDIEASAAVTFAIFRGFLGPDAVTADPERDLTELTAAIAAYLRAKGLD